jgi:hypothetical protein
MQDNQSRLRPDLHFIVHAADHLVLLSDVAITRSKSTKQQPSAVKAREQLKKRKYARFVHRGQVAFLPFVLKASGVWGSDATRVLKKLLQPQLADSLENEESQAELMRDARTRITVALHKGNALMARQCVQLVASEADTYEVPALHRLGMSASRRLFSRRF